MLPPPPVLHQNISIHASREGSDVDGNDVNIVFRVISIHASREGSDTKTIYINFEIDDFNPHFPWGKRPFPDAGKAKEYAISIHASRGGSDSSCRFRATPSPYFNPRFPWGKRHRRHRRGNSHQQFQSTLPVGEATMYRPRRWNGPWLFQSTLPVGEATKIKNLTPLKYTYFNPRFPWGKRR